MDLGGCQAQIGHNGSKFEYWESLLVPPGCTLGGLGSSLIAFGGQLVPLWVSRTSKIDAAGDHADIAKTYENHWFSQVCRFGGGFWEFGGALDCAAGTLDGQRLAVWRAGWW